MNHKGKLAGLLEQIRSLDRELMIAYHDVLAGIFDPANRHIISDARRTRRRLDSQLSVCLAGRLGRDTKLYPRVQRGDETA